MDAEDREFLQADLDRLKDWSDEWLLKFNAKKCKGLHIEPANPKYSYQMREDGGGTVLAETVLEKDLGVLVTQDLKVANQCNKAAMKAMRVLGMVKRSFKNLDADSLKTIYCSYVHPHLEYCIQAGSPYLKKDIDTLKKVQRRATKLVRGLRTMSYEERLTKLDMQSLEQRRLRGDLIEAYKILTGKEHVDPSIFFKPSPSKNLRGNSMKLFKPRSRLLSCQNFFSQRVIAYWNCLPNDVVEASSTNMFKNRLVKLWKATTWDNIQAQGRWSS